jgi:hypothetical protein
MEALKRYLSGAERSHCNMFQSPKAARRLSATSHKCHARTGRRRLRRHRRPH